MGEATMALETEFSSKNTTNPNNESEWTETGSVLGKVKITIYKKDEFGSITGGDFGPGKANETEGISYFWSLPIANICNGSDQTLVMNTLSSCMSVIGGVAQTSCQSYSLVCSGDYDGEKVSIAGVANTGGTTPTGGQLQTHGIGIDLSSVNDPGFSDLRKLPIGIYIAQPISQETKRILGIIIKE